MRALHCRAPPGARGLKEESIDSGCFKPSVDRSFWNSPLFLRFCFADFTGKIDDLYFVFLIILMLLSCHFERLLTEGSQTITAAHRGIP